MKSLLSLFAIVLFTASAYAQTGSIKGSVLQNDSTQYLSGASIYLQGTKIGTVSNGKGKFRLGNVPAGDHTIIVSSLGYFTIQRRITVRAGEELVQDFYMVESVASLSEATVMTRGNEGLDEVPGSAFYLSPKELEKFSYTDINRTLRTVPGVNLQEEDGFGLRPNIGLRGTGVERSSKITVMEDGVLMAPAPYAAPAAYFFPTIGRMYGVEILKGSSQIKYGPYTTGGAINLISTPIPEDFSGKVQLLGGSFEGRNLHVTVGGTEGQFGYMVESFQYSSDGFKELDNGGNTGFNKEDYLAKFRFSSKEEASVQQSIELKVGRSNENSNETYLGLSRDDFDANPFRRYAGSQKDQMITEHTQISLRHNIELSDHFELNTTAYRNDFRRNWYKLDKVADSTGTSVGISSLLDTPDQYQDAYDVLTGSSMSNGALFVKANNRGYYGRGVQTVLSSNFNAFKASHRVDLGLRIHEDQMDRFQWVDEYAMDNGNMELTESGTPGTDSNRLENAKAFAAYLNYALKFNKLTITPGLRYENITISRTDYGKNDPGRTGIELSERSNAVEVFIPGFGIDYKFNKFFSTFAGVHKGFAPPGSTEGTEPEQSVNYELGSRYAKNALSGEVVVFLNDYSNLLGSDLAAAGGAGTVELYNGGEVQSYGLELSLSYDLLANSENSDLSMPISIAYTYTEASFQNDFDSDFEAWGEVSSGDEIPYLANNQLSFVLGIEQKRVQFNISGRYMDAMRTNPGQGEIPVEERTDAYFILDASANYRIRPQFSIFANATNVMDEVYVVALRPAGLRPGMPRAFNIGVKASF